MKPVISHGRVSVDGVPVLAGDGEDSGPPSSARGGEVGGGSRGVLTTLRRSTAAAVSRRGGHPYGQGVPRKSAQKLKFVSRCARRQPE